MAVPLKPTSEPGIYKRQGVRGDTFTVILDHGTRADGSRDQRRKTFHSFKAAKDYKTKTLHELRAGTYVDPVTTPFGRYVDEWITARLARGVKESTVWCNRQALAYRFAALWDTPLCRITTADIERVYAAERARGIAAKTIRTADATIKQLFREAVRRGDLVANPAAVATPPPEERRLVETWTQDEARRFLTATVDDRWYPLWRTLLETGLRIGEALALRWESVDLDAGILRVERTQTRDVDDNRITGEPKSDSGRRRLALSPELVTVLRSHRLSLRETRLREGPAWNPDDLVFPNLHGEEDWQSTVNYALTQACKRAGVRRMTPHGLRHSYATISIRAGVPVKVVSQRLGHRRIQITLDLYVHPDEADSLLAAEAISGILGARAAGTGTD